MAKYANQAQNQNIKWITKDLGILENSQRKLRELQTVFEGLIREGKILDILKKDQEHESYIRLMNKYRYLSDLTEETVFQQYRSAIEGNNNTSFDNFN